MNPRSAPLGLGRLVGFSLTALSSAVVIVALAVAAFLNPVWLAIEEENARSAALSGYSRQELGAINSAVLSDLLIWTGRFEVQVRGEPVFTERERSHLADVRFAFDGLAIAAVVAAALLIVLRRALAPRRFWRAIRFGASALAGVVVGVGAFSLVAFDAAFELFHRLLFASGSYTFDPASERLVQIFPARFWSDTAIAAGGVILLLSAAAYELAGRRLKRAVAAEPATPPRLEPVRPEPAGPAA